MTLSDYLPGFTFLTADDLDFCVATEDSTCKIIHTEDCDTHRYTFGNSSPFAGNVMIAFPSAVTTPYMPADTPKEKLFETLALEVRRQRDKCDIYFAVWDRGVEFRNDLPRAWCQIYGLSSKPIPTT
jgi:hypothetical protein